MPVIYLVTHLHIYIYTSHDGGDEKQEHYTGQYLQKPNGATLVALFFVKSRFLGGGGGGRFQLFSRNNEKIIAATRK